MEKLKYALYTGCTARESTPELLKSTMAIADKLGIGTSTVQRALGHLKSYYRIAKPSEYNNIGLTDLGLAITEPILKAHEGLMKSTQSD